MIVTRRPAALVFPATVVAMGLVAGCSQILGVEDVPSTLPDAGVDATTRTDAGHSDARVEAGKDAGPGPCIAKTKRCSSDGLGFETCGPDGGFGAPVSCGAPSAVCLGDGVCTCAPGATQCVDQSFQRCVVPDGGVPRWPDAGASCPGTCTLSGCAATPPSCGPLEGGVLDSAPPVEAGSGIADCTNHDGGAESCCASNEAPGGTFDRSYDDYGNPHDDSPATVSPFRLDRFEVTVARFRRFVMDAPPGWVPDPGSGKHTHLNGGQGLVDSAADGANDGGPVYESGWDPAWNADLTSSIKNHEFFPGPTCTPAFRTWTPYVGGQEQLAMNCLTWVEAYAFCIWDSGFLPSEAEWNFAAAGGSEQRIYPWSPSLAVQRAMDGGGPNATIDCQHASFEGCKPEALTLGGARLLGDSKWLQADMAGNVDEWTLDTYAPSYVSTCTDCVHLGPIPDASAPVRVRRGGAFLSVRAEVEASYRGYDSQNDGAYTGGVRCARVP